MATEIADLPSLADLEPQRPKAPAIAGATEAHRRRGRHLAAVHRMHLEQLEQVRDVMDRVGRGEAPVQALAQAVPGLDMARNYRTAGTLCGRECRVLTFHHDAEEYQIFPLLAQEGSPGLQAVVRQLIAEHKVVHALLERLESDAAALVREPTPEGFAAARATLAALERVVRSHFGYEETELEEALGFHGLV